ncbi:hypothetical protein ACMHYB_46800 [Sorangium sp. So ce1128]
MKGNDFFKFLVAQLETGSPSFSADLARLAADPRMGGLMWVLTADLTPPSSPRAKAAASISSRRIGMIATGLPSSGTWASSDATGARSG